jgi:hypothetical protein
MYIVEFLGRYLVCFQQHAAFKFLKIYFFKSLFTFFTLLILFRVVSFAYQIFKALRLCSDEWESAVNVGASTQGVLWHMLGAFRKMFFSSASILNANTVAFHGEIFEIIGRECERSLVQKRM